MIAASAAKTATKMLRADLSDPGIAAEQALGNLDDTIANVEERVHPLSQQEVVLFGDFRWLHRRHWDQWAWSIERIAEACSAKAVCTEKYDYLRVEIQSQPKLRNQRRALEELANYVELVSDYDLFAEAQT
jgi:hypothetical protein